VSLHIPTDRHAPILYRLTAIILIAAAVRGTHLSTRLSPSSVLLL
jgi:hypothetical protein